MEMIKTIIKHFVKKCGNTVYTGYRSVEYVLKEYKKGTEKIYYYQHDNYQPNDQYSETACYYCIVDRANYEVTEDPSLLYSQVKSYYEALARERYYQKVRVRVIEQ